MDCDDARTAYSALLDGELSALAERAVLAHVDTCAACGRWAAAADVLQRRLRVRPAEPVPDLTESVLARAHPPRPGRGEWVRHGLVVVALVQLVLALPALAGNEADTAAHAARHIGAMSSALALGLLYTAWRPQRAYGVLPIVAALAAIMGVSGVIDVARGTTPLLREAIHVVELLGFVLVWMLAGSPGAPRLRRRRAAPPVARSAWEDAA